jgi:molybdopterin-containing oxidoreductase family iron-sulfur binding subunit
MSEERHELEALRARLDGTRGQQYWRSLEALSDTPEFKNFLHREFPQNASEWLDPVGRRGFLKLMSASLALAGVSACTRQPTEELVPYVRQPEELVPGKPLFFATAMPFAGSSIGLLVENHEGRPTKVEGNPDHPSSRGATDVYAQAAILGLYDPDRSRTITNLGEIRPFGAFFGVLRGVLTAQQSKKGAGLRILTETVASPTLGAQIQDILTRLPEAKWIQWEPVGRHNAREGSRLAFGDYVDTQYAIEKADVILSLDADFMSTSGSGLRHARAFASRRRVESTDARNRLYAVESTPTISSTRADHRLPLKASEVEAFARTVAAQIGVSGVSAGALSEAATRWVAPLVADLQAANGRSVIIAGESATPAVHALAHAMNAALGNVGATVTYTPTTEVQPSNQLADLKTLVSDMDGGRVDFLLIIGGNPVFTAPSDLPFGDALKKVSLRAHVGQYEDETAELCQWHVPEAHFLEAWSDVRTDDGTATVVQPLIAPLYGGKSAHEVLAAFGEGGERSGYDIVREFWSRRTGLSTAAPPVAAPAVPVPAPAPTAPAPGNAAAAPALAPLAGANTPSLSAFDLEWRRWLHDGVIANTAHATKAVTLQAMPAASAAAASGLEVVFRADPSVYDGRFANNGWLQELPKVLTKLTWDNGALIAPGTAQRLGLISGDVVQLKHGDRNLRIPVWLAPGQALDTLTLHLGYGRARAGRIGTGIGFNVNPMRSSDALDTLTGVELTKTGDSYELVSTQDHWSLEGRNLVRVATAAQYQADPQFAKKQEHQPERLTLYDAAHFTYDGYRWGMAIDQNVCTGCNSCVVACQAENNVPVVGKSQVANGREMHWLRIDRYYTGDLDTPDTYHQPMPCQQCENAPCEVVCPVSATVHSDEGLNDMVYNRCVGTRYCSNNCPYKVRRFNFLLYQDFDTPSLKLARNPDVTVRSRGVMEKCTYCVQRVNQARVAAKLDDREIRDGEVVSACQAACPTDAIVFGNLNDPNSRVAKLKASALNYGLLEELNTRPRTTYLAIVRNPNTTLEPATAAAAGGEEKH